MGPPQKRTLLWGKDEQRSERALPPAAGRGMRSLRGRSPASRTKKDSRKTVLFLFSQSSPKGVKHPFGHCFYAETAFFHALYPVGTYSSLLLPISPFLVGSTDGYAQPKCKYSPQPTIFRISTSSINANNAKNKAPAGVLFFAWIFSTAKRAPEGALFAVNL